jgi:UDPglucose--hexose-1-phosphate uridylyltransferase
LAELRRDYILDRYVIIATERAKRPHQFTQPVDQVASGICYFCPGNESLTPVENYRISSAGAWSIRVFDNRYPAVGATGEPALRTDNTFYTFADAVGRHEVVVETPCHDLQLADLSEDEIKRILVVYGERIRTLSANPAVKYVQVFKNSGSEGGCSIAHSHSQIIAYNMVPPVVLEKEAAVDRYHGCPYCSIIQSEKDSYRRIYEDSSVVSFTPYASRFPFEALILPKRHVVEYGHLNMDEISGLAHSLKRILGRLRALNAPYNYYIHYGVRNLHLQMTVAPRFPSAKHAGFELATETIINPISPESAAEFYRSEQKVYK